MAKVKKSAEAWVRLEVKANARRYRTRTGAQRGFAAKVKAQTEVK